MNGGEWGERFARARGRRPRVLHVGNVANNAYLNARLLNEGAVDCDVLGDGDYYMMASPEWEELDGEARGIDHERPDWRQVSSARFERPRWFAQGPFPIAAAYLEARREGRELSAALRWRQLDARRRAVASGWSAAARKLRRARATSAATDDPRDAARADPAEDIGVYGAARRWSPARLRRLFDHYDLVHGYGASPILPLVAGTHPYIAFEHGTLRHLPFQPTVEGRLVARAYAGADAVVITNADCRTAAEALGISRYRFIPHPINEARPTPASVVRLRDELARPLDADFLVFHPSRHHWSPDRNPHLEKGNDRLIHGLARFFAQRPRAAAVFVDWGASVDASRALLRDCGIAERVQWIPPQTSMSLARHMMATDVTADQFHLGAFGSTLPRAMYLERPSLIHLDAAAHAWCLPELPPVINARAAEEIANGLVWAYDDPAGRRELGARASRWYDQYHSSRVLQGALSALYDAVWSRRDQ
jgi:glycosyltransferase involved in cell wall biosynthesis